MSDRTAAESSALKAELTTMAKMSKLLDSLTPSGKGRVMAWLHDVTYQPASTPAAATFTTSAE